MNDDAFSPWQLDDSDTPRQRYTKNDVKRGQTDIITCRASSFHVRRMDEIVASRIDPVFKTRSDVIQDAIAMWLEDWDRRYPDGATGELTYQARLERLERRQQLRTDFITRAEEQMQGLRTSGDMASLREYLQIMVIARANFQDDAPPKYLERMDELINHANRLLHDGF